MLWKYLKVRNMKRQEDWMKNVHKHLQSKRGLSSHSEIPNQLKFVKKSKEQPNSFPRMTYCIPTLSNGFHFLSHICIYANKKALETHQVLGLFACLSFSIPNRSEQYLMIWFLSFRQSKYYHSKIPSYRLITRYNWFYQQRAQEFDPCLHLLIFRLSAPFLRRVSG